MARKSVIAAALIATAITLEPLAFAYILPAEVILSTMAKRRAEIAFTTIVAEGTYQRGSGPPLAVWEAIQAGLAYRRERKGPNGTEVALTTQSRRWTFKLGEKAPPPVKIAGDLFLTFIGASEKDSGGARGHAFLRALGIDESVVSLARLDKRVAYIIGAKPWEPKKPQLWVDKEFFVPTRLIEVDKQGSVTDTRLLGFGSATTGEWYPARVEVWRDGNLIEATNYSSAQLNEEVAEELLKPPS